MVPSRFLRMPWAILSCLCTQIKNGNYVEAIIY